MIYKVKCTSQELINYALKNTPSLIIDCANAADPHTYFPYHDEECFENTYVLPVDLLYKFRDSLLQTQEFIQEKKHKSYRDHELFKTISLQQQHRKQLSTKSLL